MTYQVEGGGAGVCAFQATSKGFYAECTADGTKGGPTEGCRIVACSPRGEGVRNGELVCGLCEGGGPEQEGL